MNKLSSIDFWSGKSRNTETKKEVDAFDCPIIEPIDKDCNDRGSPQYLKTHHLEHRDENKTESRKFSMSFVNLKLINLIGDDINSTSSKNFIK